MFIGGLYLLSFLSGIFVLWYFGKKAYYAEEKLIDLALFSTVVGLMVSRVSFLLSPMGREDLSSMMTSQDVGISLLSLLQINAGYIIWIGILGFIATVLFLLYKWNWPLWPVSGLVLWGVGTAITISEIMVWKVNGFTSGGIVIIASSLVCLLMAYLFMFQGNVVVRDLWVGFKKGYKEKRLQTKKIDGTTDNEQQKNNA